MSTVEEFEAAPFGATTTATQVWKRAVKTFYEGTDRNWLTRDGEWLSAQEMADGDWTLDPAPTAPSSAREALDLAWELAHPVDYMATVPAGTEVIRMHNGLPELLVAKRDLLGNTRREYGDLRTLDPLPDPEPDWLTAPAVLATHEATHDDANPIVWAKHQFDSDHWISGLISAHWTSLRNVIPLYPKGQDS